MPTDLLIAPVGAGKTERALDELIKIKSQPDGAFLPIWVLLPGKRQEDAFRQRLIERQSRVYFNVTFFSFYTLYAYLLDIAGIPQREVEETARLRLLRFILTGMKSRDELTIYQAIAEKPGFARTVADFIAELKQNVVQPDDFELAAQTGSDKDRDLARIYTAYQDLLRERDLVDKEGEGWLALAEIEKQPTIASDVALLIVDGFDQFNLLQAQLLALLASRAKQTLITMPAVPGREATVGRRFIEAINRLQTAYQKFNQTIHLQPISTSKATRHDALTYITEWGFRVDAKPRPSDGKLAFIEAPDSAHEAGAVMRRVKRLLLESSPPDEILIAVRDWERYGEHLATHARIYGIPVALHYGEKLTSNPAIVALLNLLKLSSQDFRRRDLLDTLRSPYFHIPELTSEQIDQLEQVSQSQVVLGGRELWLEAIAAASRASLDEDDDANPLLTSEQSADLSTRLKHFFNALKPPSENRLYDTIAWVENLIGADEQVEADEQIIDAPYTLNMLSQLRGTIDDAAIISRDLLALRTFKNVLRQLYAAQNLFAALGLSQTEDITWTEFLADLEMTLEAAAVNQGANRSGRVLITTVSDARGLPHKHVFIPGLSEGLFPALTSEDPLYLDSERLALTARGIPLETQAERAADEGLFYELISLPRESLTLSRPTLQNGAFWPESHLWRTVRVLFSDADTLIERDRIRLGAVVKAEDAASSSEAILAVAQALNAPELTAHDLSLYNWLVSQRQADWERIHNARQIELNRMTNPQATIYSGRLSASPLLSWVADELGERRTWSASQFNDYGQCGFRFFAKRLLKLEKVEEPETGMDAAQLGTLNHAILEKTYRQLGENGASITPEFLDQALQTLHEVAEAELTAAPNRYAFRASALWQQEKRALLRRLEALVKLDFSADSPVTKKFGDEPRQPYRLEMPFREASNMVQIPISPEVGHVRVTGYIDRIDRQGDRAIFIDYKTGSKTIPTKEMQQGRNFQMMLYLLVGQIVLAEDPEAPHPAGGLFWHLRNGNPSGAIRLDNIDDENAIEQARDHLSQHIQRGREGDFRAHPNKTGNGPCSHYCEFSQFCRVSIMRRPRREE